MSISTLGFRVSGRLILSLVAILAAAWRAEAQQQYYYPAADGSATAYAAPTYTYDASQPVQYVQQPAAPQYYYQSGYAGVEAAQPAQAQVTYAPAAEAAPAAAPAAPAASYGDPYGFTAWLNGIRASYGLGAVGYDPNLASWAAMNNDQQASRGLGHHVMGPARRQNSAMGGFPGVESMWMASPAHRAALLDPTITWIGIAGAGAWWTFNAN